MRILFITYHFPPRNTIGAVRTGKTAKYLRSLGHEVMVVAAEDTEAMQGQPVEVPDDSVVYVRDPGVRWSKRLQIQSSDEHPRLTRPRHGESVLLRVLRRLRRAVYLPDGMILWFPGAYRAALLLGRRRDYDVVLGSAWPLTSLLVAKATARRLRLPWVAELRDLWSDNHYLQRGSTHARLDRALERRTLASAAGLVTVSQEWATVLSRKYDTPVAVILGGHQDERGKYGGVGVRSSRRDTLRIVYTGRLYGSKRDPTTFFRALEQLGPQGQHVEALFVGPDLAEARRLAAAYTHRSRIDFCSSVDYEQARALQASADVLLLLLWDHKGEEGVIPGKVFEYMGVRKPILVLGPTWTAAARLVNDVGAGIASSDASRVARYLTQCLEEKRAYGRVRFEPTNGFADLSSEAQTTKLADFLLGVSAHQKLTHGDRR